MKKILLIYTVFIILLLSWKQIVTNKQWVGQIKQDYILGRLHTKILKKIPDNQKKYFNLMAAFTVGDEKKSISRLKSSYKSLGLVHLFTPSGFHLQAILICLSYLGLKKHRRKFLLSLLLIFFIPGFSALKRIVILKICESYYIHLKKWIPKKFYLFLLVFLLFFLCGDYYRNPLSYSLSFLFLGTIYALNENPKLYYVHYFLAFFMAQLLVQLFLPQEVTLAHFSIGFILGLIFNILFPVISICYISSYLVLLLSNNYSAFFSRIILFPTKIFHNLCAYFSKIHFSITNFHGALIITLIILAISNHLLKKHLSKLAAILCLAFFSTGIKKEFKLKKSELKISQDSLKAAAISRLISL